MKIFTVTVLFVLAAAASAVEENSDAARHTHLKHLAGAIKGYQIIHDGRSPAKLSDLYQEGLTDSLGDFVQPDSGTKLSVESEIDKKSDYTMEGLESLRDILVREKRPVHGSAELLVVVKDGTIKSIPAPSVAASNATPSPSVSPTPPGRVVEAKPTPSETPTTSPVSKGVIAATTPVLTSPPELLTVPAINAAGGAGLAGKVLAQAGFTPVFKNVPAKSKDDEFKIAGQSPRPGEKRARGSDVIIYVYQKFEGATNTVPTIALSPAPSPGFIPTVTVAKSTPPPLGSWSSAPGRNSASPPPRTSPLPATTSSRMTDLVNPQKKIVGTWQGPRHRKQFFPDGTFVTDPHLVPNPPITRWSITGDRVTEYYSSTNLTYRILSLTDQELVTTDDKGNTFRATKIPDEQAAREKANW